MNLKIDAVVVLYNPNGSVIENIKTYQQVNTIYVVDNSEQYNEDIIEKLKQFKNLIYINNHGNQGIAYALNIGASKAIKDGANWLLTMDQDSRFKDNGLEILIDWILHNDTSKIGIISPCHLTLDKIDTYKKEDKVVDRLTVMTSGNLLNLEAYQRVGKFEEKYFIDYVDHEYCLRLQANNYKIKVHKGSLLIHELGNISYKKFLGKRITYTNHNYIRRYYITRNRLDVIRKYFFRYPTFSVKEIKSMISDWMKIILFEQDKLRKQKSILLGIFDFMRNKYGKYDN